MIPEELSKALQERRVVPFVGAGVSQAVLGLDGEPAFFGWERFLEHAETAVRRQHTEAANFIQSLIKQKNLKFAAQVARETLAEEWLPFVRREFDRRFEEVNPESLGLARLLWRLGSDLLITTNYDLVLQWAAEEEGRKGTHCFTCAGGEHLAAIQKGAIAKPSIWHLHGIVTDAKNIILTPDGYGRLYPAGGEAEFQAGLETLRHFATARTLLFVGFDLEEAIREQLQWVEEKYHSGGCRHYVLVREKSLERMQLALKGLPVEAVSFADFGAPMAAKVEELIVVAGETARPVRPARDRTRYDEWMEAECAYIKLQALKISSGKAGQYPIDELYIEGMARGPEKEQPLGEAVSGLLSCVVEGDAGSGKSTFLKKLAWDQCRGKKRFPILIQISEFDRFLVECPVVKDKAPAGMADGRWVPYYLEQREWGLDEGFFAEMLGKAETTVLLDGLDEAADEGRRARVARIFEAARRLYPKCQFVVTTRPSAYEGTSVITGFTAVRIEDLGAEQIGKFVGLWSLLLHHGNETGAAAHEKELRRALERPEIRRMARNPLMLTALAVVQWNDKVLPEQRAALYESIVTWLAKSRMERPERKKSWEECLRLLGVLALRMQNYEGGHRVSLGRGDAAVLLAGEFENVAAASRFLLAEEIDSGIITSSGDAVRYWHRTFQEYLAAWRLSGMTDEELWAGAEPYLYVREWREVMLLLAGCLCEAKGHGRLDLFLRKVLGTSGGTLGDKARCVALVAGMLNDLRAAKYVMPAGEAGRYEALKGEVQDIFTVSGAAKVPAKVRAEVGDALGVEGHPGVYLPSDERYWVRLEGGEFLMGAQKTDKKGANYDREAQDDEPVQAIKVGGFWMGRYPVTVYEYGRFLEAHGERERPGGWEEQELTPTRPVVGVDFGDAEAYCGWAGGRLPSEEEWEYATRGGKEGRRYPWGEAEPDESRANYKESGVGHPSAVGLFPAGHTREGIADLAGNVWEWTSSDYSEDGKTVRGGSCWGVSLDLRGAYRYYFRPGGRSGDVGFRCIRE